MDKKYINLKLNIKKELNLSIHRPNKLSLEKESRHRQELFQKTITFSALNL